MVLGYAAWRTFNEALRGDTVMSSFWGLFPATTSQVLSITIALGGVAVATRWWWCGGAGAPRSASAAPMRFKAARHAAVPPPPPSRRRANRQVRPEAAGAIDAEPVLDTAGETARIAQACLRKLGYTFRT